MEWKTKIKSIAPIGALIIVVVAVVIFIVFRGAEPVNAPTTTDIAAVATSTATTTPVAPVPVTAPGMPSPVVNNGVQIINGDGFTATVRPVISTGEAPVIESFTVKQKENASCVFSWEVEQAASCDIVNTIDGTGVKGVPVVGSLQTNDAGTYQLKCKGSGGKVAVSEVVACK